MDQADMLAEDTEPLSLVLRILSQQKGSSSVGAASKVMPKVGDIGTDMSEYQCSSPRITRIRSLDSHSHRIRWVLFPYPFYRWKDRGPHWLRNLHRVP